MKYKILISSSYFTATPNGTKRQPDESWRSTAREDFAYHSGKLVLLAKCNRYEVGSDSFFFCKW